MTEAHAHVRSGSNVFIAALDGEIDIGNSAELEGRLGALLGDATDVVVDLGGVRFMDSQGIAVVGRLSSRIESAGGRFAVVAPPSGVPRRVLEIVDLGVQLFEDLDDALAAFGADVVSEEPIVGEPLPPAPGASPAPA